MLESNKENQRRESKERIKWMNKRESEEQRETEIWGTVRWSKRNSLVILVVKEKVCKHVFDNRVWIQLRNSFAFCSLMNIIDGELHFWNPKFKQLKIASTWSEFQLFNKSKINLVKIFKNFDYCRKGSWGSQTKRIQMPDFEIILKSFWFENFQIWTCKFTNWWTNCSWWKGNDFQRLSKHRREILSTSPFSEIGCPSATIWDPQMILKWVLC